MYKQLVKEITDTFKKISDAIIEIQKSLDTAGYKQIAKVMSNIQASEKDKLELVSTITPSASLISRLFPHKLNMALEKLLHQKHFSTELFLFFRLSNFNCRVKTCWINPMIHSIN